MTHYRLLRDNKESGPYSEEELIAKGFKPYDLLWAEGKSAGWRYPSEIPSFKNYAPAIEEQPYDRFYKKQPPQKLFSEERTTHPSFSNITGRNTEQPQQQQQPAPAAIPPVEQDHRFQSLPARHIHVTLPSGSRVNLTTLVSKKENKETRDIPPVKNNDAKPEPSAAPVQSIPTSFVTQTDANTTFVDEKAADISYRPKQVQANSGLSWGLIAAAFIGIATLVGLGIMIGLSISRDKSELAFNEALRLRSKQAASGTAGTHSTKPAPSVTETPVTGIDEPLQRTGDRKELVQNAVVKSSLLPENADIKNTKKLPAEKSATDNKSLAPDEPVMPAKPLPAPINLEKQILLTANDFKTGAFGGISGLKYTLVNGSRFPIESVEVEIDYIQANNKVYKTEKLVFKDIPAGATTTIEAPASSRGIKTSSRIVKINSREALSNTTARS